MTPHLESVLVFNERPGESSRAIDADSRIGNREQNVNRNL